MKVLPCFKHADLLTLGELANGVRKRLHPERLVTFIVDRNINYTNICVNKCKFCAFYRDADSPEAYILSKEEIFKKIEETIAQGGTQILMQGGVHPDLGIEYFEDLFSSIKATIHYPDPFTFPCRDIISLQRRRLSAFWIRLNVSKPPAWIRFPAGAPRSSLTGSEKK